MPIPTSPVPAADFVDELRHLDRWLGVPDARLDLHGQAVAAILKRRFDCSLVTLWCMHAVDEERSLVCCVALDDEPSSVRPDTVLREADCPDYFAALARRGVFASPDALADPRLAGMRDAYLVPQRIRALLDAAVQINGVTHGVLCLEQRDAPRTWSRTDEADLRRAGVAISLALGRHISAALARRP